MTKQIQDEEDLKAFKEENIVIPNNSIGVTFLHYGKECAFLGWKVGRKHQREASANELAECQAREANLQEWVKKNARHANHCMKLDYLDEREFGCTCGLESISQPFDHSALDEAINKAVEAALREAAEICDGYKPLQARILALIPKSEKG